MSDSEDSTITYTAVPSPFGGLSDIGSPRVDGPLVMPEDPYTYVVAAFQAPPSPDYVLGLEYPPSPEFVPEPAQSMDASDAARSGVIALRTRVSAPRTEIIDLRAADRIFLTTVGTQQEEIRELQVADRKLQAQFIHALTTLKSCQTQLTAALIRSFAT
nr:hypothetical protein [Tanacetum cinerariifolium]